MSLNCYIFGKLSYRNRQTYTERQEDIVVRKIDSRADNLGFNPGSTVPPSSSYGLVVQPLCASVYSCVKRG